MSIRTEFRKSLKLGTGRAFLIARDNPEMDFSADIIKAALNNYVYDIQCEDSRAEYVACFRQFVRDKQRFDDAVINGLVREKNYQALGQLYDLAAILAVKFGNEKARKAIYRRYQRKPIKDYEDIGTEAIIKSCGLDGLILYARRMGRLLQEGTDWWIGDYYIEQVQESKPELDVYAEMKKIARSDDKVKSFLDQVKKDNKDEIKRPEPVVVPYAEIVRRIENSEQYIRTGPRTVKCLSRLELCRLAEKFLAETNFKIKEKYLGVFVWRKYPFDYTPILEMIKNEKRLKGLSFRRACEALQYHQGSDIRRLVLGKLAGTKKHADYLNLLVSNYRDTDAKLLTGIVDSTCNQNKLHDMVWSLCRIYDNNKTRTCKRPLEAMYEKLACGNHREDILKIMYENGVLSERILEEMQYDFAEGVRELYAKIMRKKARGKVGNNGKR